jgi:hypothetical protein
MASHIRRACHRLEVRLRSPAALVPIGLAIVAIAFASRLTLLAVLGYRPAVEFYEMERLARSLAETGVFGNPYALPTGPSAHHAPVYPALLAGLFLLFGYGAAAAWAVVLMNFTFAAVQYALLPVLARIAGLPMIPAIAAGLAGAALPFRVLKEVAWDATLVALAMVLGLTLAVWWRRERVPSYRRSLVAGAGWGLCLLAAPGVLPMLGVLAAWWFLTALVERRASVLPRLAVLLLAAVVVLVPWTVRNYRTLGGLIFVRSNFGLEFSLSNRDGAHVTMKDNVQIGFPRNYFTRHHPLPSAAEAVRVREMGEIAYNRERLSRALAWCREHPGDFARLMLGRFVGFWAMPTGTQPWKDALLQPITLLGLAGLVVVWRRNREAGAAFAAAFAGFPLVYYFVQLDPRYRYPMEWMFLLLAGQAAWLAAARLLARGGEGPPAVAEQPAAGRPPATARPAWPATLRASSRSGPRPG